MMAVWADGVSPSQSNINMFLGHNVKAIDINGNPVKIEFENGKHRIQLTDSPVFLIGIDTKYSHRTIKI